MIYDEFGVVKTYHVGGLYNKRVSLSKTSDLYIGTQLYYQSRVTDFAKLRYIHTDDPLLQDLNTDTKNNVSFDFGLMYYSNRLSVGAGYKNILDTKTDESSLSFIIAREFDLLSRIKVTPSVHIASDFDYTYAHANATFEIRKRVLLGGGYMLSYRGHDAFGFNAGLNIKDWVQIVTHVFSSARLPFGSREIEALIRVKIPETREREGQ